MNLQAAQISLRSKIGNPTTANVPDATLTGYLNDAYRFVATRYPFNEMRKVVSFSTAVGTDRYIVPPDLAVVKKLWDDTNKKQIMKRGVNFVSSLPKNMQTGKPKWYFRADDWMQIIPSVDGIYSLMLYYQIQPAALVNAADTPIIPVSWHDGWVLKARHIYYDEKGDIGKAIYANNAWKDWVADKPSEIDQEKEDTDQAVDLVEKRYGYMQRPRRDPSFDPLFDETC